MRTRTAAYALVTVASLGLVAQSARADKTGRLSGNVLDVGKAEITLQNGTAHRVVVYTASTRFTIGAVGNSKTANAGSADEVKPGNYATCAGTWDGVKLAATACTIRPSKRP